MIVTLLRRLRGALGMGLFWALGGAAIGGFIELLDNLGVGWYWIDRIDMWIPLLAIPGFFGGIAFSIVLGVAGRGRKFEEMSLPRFALWGALGGLLLGGFALAVGMILDPAFVLIVPALFCSVAATGTLVIARAAERPALSPPSREG